MSDFLAKNVHVIRSAVDHHNGTCPIPARAILLHPVEHGRLGVTSLWGLAVCADERVRIGHFRIDCGGSAWGVEDELLAYVGQSIVEETPVPVHHLS